MKKSILILVLVMICIGFAPYAGAAGKASAILEYKHDVTGDGQLENLIVYGVPIKENKNFYQEVWVEIEQSNGKKLRIDYERGFEPKLDFKDLNHDGIDDILFSSAVGGSGGLNHYALHTVANGNVQEIELPSLQIDGFFEEDFEAVIKIEGLKKPILLDLWKRKKDYLTLGLYQENGMLNEPTELMIDPVAVYDIIPVKNGYGLKSYRQIRGAYHEDRLGIVETQWYYTKGKWTPVEIKWIASRNLSKVRGE